MPALKFWLQNGLCLVRSLFFLDKIVYVAICRSITEKKKKNRKAKGRRDCFDLFFSPLIPSLAFGPIYSLEFYERIYEKKKVKRVRITVLENKKRSSLAREKEERRKSGGERGKKQKNQEERTCSLLERVPPLSFLSPSERVPP